MKVVDAWFYERSESDNYDNVSVGRGSDGKNVYICWNNDEVIRKRSELNNMSNTILNKFILTTMFCNAEKRGANYIAIAIQKKGNKGKEIIINPKENFKEKLEYYSKAYDDNLILNNCDDISIVAITFADTLNELADKLRLI